MGGSITEYTINNDGSLGDASQNIVFSGNGTDKEGAGKISWETKKCGP